VRLHIFKKLFAASHAHMNAEALVTRRYPLADCVFCTEFHCDCRVGEWAILDQPGLIDMELGRGPTEDAAWEDAARNLANRSEDETAA
jgi:hypothetical protein